MISQNPTTSNLKTECGILADLLGWLRAAFWLSGAISQRPPIFSRISVVQNSRRPCENSTRGSVRLRREPIFASFSALRGCRPRNLSSTHCAAEFSHGLLDLCTRSSSREGLLATSRSCHSKPNPLFAVLQTNYMSDHGILTAALRPAVEAYGAKTAESTLLGRPEPDGEILTPVAEAIDQCTAFQAVKGHALFTGRLGLDIEAGEMASHLVHGAISYNPDPAANKVDEAASWLLRVLATRKTKALFHGAIWGLSIDSEILLPSGARLVPFAALPDSYLKSSIEHRSTNYTDIVPWLNTRFHELPRAGYIQEIPSFPYIDPSKGSAYKAVEDVTAEALEYWTVLQAASVGHPLAISYWMGYEDRSLLLEEWKVGESWSLPEIPPFVKEFRPADGDALRSDMANYIALSGATRGDLLRSMKRFTLGQCRRETVDRVLDLALAFEIAVSGGDQNLAVSWKVSVRTAQFVGGSLAVPQKNRKIVSDLYTLRSKATHGSSLASIPEAKQTATVDASYAIYGRLIKCLLSLGHQPDWNTIELEPRTQDDGTP